LKNDNLEEREIDRIYSDWSWGNRLWQMDMGRTWCVSCPVSG